MASEYTPNRRYPLYTDTDKPNLRDQYNGAIREIDADMAQALQDSSAVSSALGAGFDAQHTVRMAIDSAGTSITNLGTAIDNEATARQNADTALGTRIDNEVTARQSADTALGTRITNETSARESADTALGTRITNETSARENADTALSSRVATVESKLTPCNFVLFGDSWNSFVAESRPNWFDLANIGNVLNADLKNFSIGGAGYVGGSSQISAQIATAGTTLTSDEKAKTKYVVFLGGVNDTADSNLAYSTWLTAVINCLNSAASMFPNAKILFAVNACSPYYSSNGVARFRRLNQWARQLCDDLVWKGKSVLVTAQTAYFWGPQQPSNLVFVNDMLHPNATGAYAIGKIILAALSGGSACIDTHLNNSTNSSLTIPSGNYSGSFAIGVEKGDIRLFGTITKTGDTRSEMSLDVPRSIQEFVLAKVGEYNFGWPLLGISADGDAYLWCRFTSTATKLLCAAKKADTYYFA